MNVVRLYFVFVELTLSKMKGRDTDPLAARIKIEDVVTISEKVQKRKDQCLGCGTGCGKGFIKATQVKPHMDIQTGKMILKCQTCGKNFRRPMKILSVKKGMFH